MYLFSNFSFFNVAFMVQLLWKFSMKVTIQPQDTKSLAQTWHAMIEFYSTASLLLSINSLLQS